MFQTLFGWKKYEETMSDEHPQKENSERVKIGFSLSEWLEIILDTPQGSILGPTLLNISEMTSFYKRDRSLQFRRPHHFI